MKKIYPGKTLADIFRVAFADRLWLGSILSVGASGVPWNETATSFGVQGLGVKSW